jgi:hypothetical protein
VGRTISNPPRVGGKKREHQWKSEEARERATAAGARNLAKYRESLAGNPHQPNSRHNVVAFLHGGTVPEAIAAKLDEFQAGLLSDLGDAPTTAQRCLVEATRTSLGVCLLAQSYLGQGNLSSLKSNRWLLQTLATFVNSTRLALCALGLERRAKEVLTLDDVVRDISARRATDAKSAAASPEATQVENVAEGLESHA